MKRPKGWAVAIALQLGTCGLAGCSSTAPPLPGVGSQAAVEPHQSIEQMMAAARFLENQGVQHHDQEKLEMARQGYLSVLARNPESQFAHHRLAILAARGGMFDTAEIHFQKAKAAGVASSELLADMGYNYYLQNRLEEAEQSLREAVAKDSRNETAINNLGLVLGEMGKTDEALASFEQVVGTAEAHANLAKVYTHLGRLEEAKEQYNLALSMNQNMRNAAEALVQLEDATSARRLAHQHSQQRHELAQHRHPNQYRRQPEQTASRRGMLPDFEELFGRAEPQRESHVRPVSEQRPVDAPQPMREEQYFDPQAGQIPRTDMPMHSAEVQVSDQVSMADLAATLGNIEQRDAERKPAPRQTSVQPATTRVASPASSLQASLAQPEPVMHVAPPLPTNDAEYQTFQQPASFARTPEVRQPSPTRPAMNLPAGPDVYPQAQPTDPVVNSPTRIVNPFVAEARPSQANKPKTIVPPADEELAPLPSLADEFAATSPSSSSMAPSSVASEGAPQPKQITFATAQVEDDLPVGEPNLAPIALRATTPAPTAASISHAPFSGSKMDFRVSSGNEPRSLQKLLDDEDY